MERHVVQISSSDDSLAVLTNDGRVFLLGFNGNDGHYWTKLPPIPAEDANGEQEGEETPGGVG